jgi:uncharacterized protein (TIGR04255 family)
MTDPPSVDLSQRFPELPKPPIVEAVISFVARARSDWTPEAVSKRIMEALPDYPLGMHMNQARFSFAVQAGEQATQPEVGSPTHAAAENMGWLGMRLSSLDQQRVVTPNRDGLTLSWLGEYVGWDNLSAEMLRLWEIHKGIAAIDSIDRIEIRYVNRLEVPAAGIDPGIYFQGFGTPPAGMARGPFLHQDSLVHPALIQHVVNVIRTFEPPSPSSPTLPLLLVLEAANADPFPDDRPTIARRLAELHWLKNHAFFSSVTDEYLELCK